MVQKETKPARQTTGRTEALAGLQQGPEALSKVETMKVLQLKLRHTGRQAPP